jgi:hypothetical protein
MVVSSQLLALVVFAPGEGSTRVHLDMEEKRKTLT